MEQFKLFTFLCVKLFKDTQSTFAALKKQTLSLIHSAEKFPNLFNKQKSGKA